MTIRAYMESDLPYMISVWNEVVQDGIAFPQEELLDMESGTVFFLRRKVIAELQWTEKRLPDFISYTRIMLDAVGIFAMRVTLLAVPIAGNTLENN